MATAATEPPTYLNDASTWKIITTQNIWWRSRSDGWLPIGQMRLAHRYHVLGWLEDHAQEILREGAAALYDESRSSLFSDDLIAEANYLQDMAAEDWSARLAVRLAPLYQRLVFLIHDVIGSGK